MTTDCYEKLRKIWQGLGGKPLPRTFYKKNRALKKPGPS